MKTILVVDDSWEIGEMVTERLELAGYRSLLAGGATPQQCFKDWPDMVLCDLPVLPEASADAARTMRAARGAHATPVVIMSSYYGYVATDERSQVALKPFSLHALLEIVEAKIGRP
jgi:DNA-binding response OmpR family regulator